MDGPNICFYLLIFVIITFFTLVYSWTKREEFATTHGHLPDQVAVKQFDVSFMANS